MIFTKHMHEIYTKKKSKKETNTRVFLKINEFYYSWALKA